MEITGKGFPSLVSGHSVPNVNRKEDGNFTAPEDLGKNPKIEQDLKEVSREMIKEPRLMGEWGDKEGLEETTDPTMGGDIRYALKSKNIDYLKRLLWGNLTISELREISHRIKELEQTKTKDFNVLGGKIIDTEA